MDEIIEDYDDIVEKLLNSNNSTFESRLKQFVTFIDSKPIKSVIESLPYVDFDDWYKNAKGTVGSFVGSGELDWPIDLKENTAMHLALLREISEGGLTVPDFCCDFLYSDNNFNIMVMDFNEQITGPVTSDIRKLIVRSLFSSEHSKPTTLLSYENDSNWYQRPIGIIGIGLFVTIVGGIAVSKLAGIL